jgi:hypothetical protein
VNPKSDPIQHPAQFSLAYFMQGVSGESAIFRANITCIKLHGHKQEHLYPKLNGYEDNGEKFLKNEGCYALTS